jgi:hypothetical protein
MVVHLTIKRAVVWRTSPKCISTFWIGSKSSIDPVRNVQLIFSSLFFKVSYYTGSLGSTSSLSTTRQRKIKPGRLQTVFSKYEVWTEPHWFQILDHNSNSHFDNTKISSFIFFSQSLDYEVPENQLYIEEYKASTPKVKSHLNNMYVSSTCRPSIYCLHIIFVATHQNWYVKMGCDVVGWHYDSISCCFHWHLYWRTGKMEIQLYTQMYPWLLALESYCSILVGISVLKNDLAY